MKRSSSTVLSLSVIAGLALAGQSVFAGIVFSDNFSNGSTVNGSNFTPTSDSTAYQIVSGKSYSPTPSISAGDLQFGIGATSGGTVEAQALFSPSLVSLNSVGDSIQLNLTFTDTSGILTAEGLFGIGMYNSGGVAPLAGGLNGTATSGNTNAATGGVQNWQGYVGLVTNGKTSEIMDRQAQTGTGNNNQDLVTTGSSTYSYHNPEGGAVGGSADSSQNVTLTAGNVYTDVLTYTLNSGGALHVDNNLYSGSTGSGSSLSTLSADISSPLTTSFDGFAVGYYAKNSTSPNQFDINSITVTTMAVPEPSSLAFAALGLLGAFLPRFRRR